MIIELFRREHLDELTLGDTVADLIKKANFYAISEKLNWRDMAVTVMDDGGIVMAIVAMADVIYKPGRKARYVSFILSREAKQRPVWLTRSVMRGLDFLHHHQGVELVAAEAVENTPRRWLERMGFIEENGVYFHGSKSFNEHGCRTGDSINDRGPGVRDRDADKRHGSHVGRQGSTATSSVRSATSRQ
tara:strand:- start:942 stop:1508 length:567 start_codon:yes stop_codon:yes gene_type:complete